MSVPDRKKQYTAELLLLTVTLFWGSTFPLMKEAIEQIPVMSFLFIRFAVASLLLLLIAGRGMKTLDRKGVGRGIFLGTLLFGAYLFQTLGLEITSSANAGFVTGLNVVWVPLLVGPILKKAPAPASKIGVVCALIGLFMLTWQSPWHINPGDALVFICSFFVAFHILGLDALTTGYDGRALTFVQIATMTVLSLVGSLIFEPYTWPQVWSTQLTWCLIITAVFATSYAFWVMTSFQKWTTPTRAALIYTCEPVFAAIFSVWLLNEQLGLIAWAGGALIVVGMLVAEILPVILEKRRATASPLN